jgi:peptidoglycan/xylan/chitin deacetylase (PgdA/CDA1 family)
MAEKTLVQISVEVQSTQIQLYLGIFSYIPIVRDTISDVYQTGLFAGTEGTRRLLKLFDKYKMKATWFIPGHSLETFPDECAMIRDQGHEIGLHGYSHENPVDMTMEQQRDVLDKT